MFSDNEEFQKLCQVERELAMQIAWKDCPELMRSGKPEDVLKLSKDAMQILEHNSSYGFSLRHAARAIEFLRPHLDIQPPEEDDDGDR